MWPILDVLKWARESRAVPGEWKHLMHPFAAADVGHLYRGVEMGQKSSKAVPAGE